MLTKKGKYGLKALVDLAQLGPGETAFISEIALRNNIPKKFLDTILLELRNGGILRSKKARAAVTPCRIPPVKSVLATPFVCWMGRLRRSVAPAAPLSRLATIVPIRSTVKSGGR